MIEQLIEQIKKRADAIRREGDYIDQKTGLLHCGVCGEPKQKVVDPHICPPFPVRLECRCERQQSQREKEALDRYQQELRQKELFRGIKSEAFRRFTFSRDDSRHPEISKLCCDYVRSFREMEALSGGLLFYGDVGGGKSFYAGCIANALIKRGVPVLFTGLRDLIDNRQAAKYRGEPPVALKNYRLFVLDDIGTENLNRADLETAFSVVDDIYLLNRPLIVTTNLTLPQLETPSNQEAARLYSRIRERCPKSVFVDNQQYNRIASTKERCRQMDELLLLSRTSNKRAAAKR